MKEYVVTNGYTGYSTTVVFVVARDEEHALELAKKQFKKEANESNYYDEGYYKSIRLLEKLSDDVDLSNGYCSPSTD